MKYLHHLLAKKSAIKIIQEDLGLFIFSYNIYRSFISQLCLLSSKYSLLIAFICFFSTQMQHWTFSKVFQEIPRWMYKEDTPTISAHMVSCDVLRDNAVSYSEVERVPLALCNAERGTKFVTRSEAYRQGR